MHNDKYTSMGRDELVAAARKEIDAANPDRRAFRELIVRYLGLSEPNENLHHITRMHNALIAEAKLARAAILLINQDHSHEPVVAQKLRDVAYIIQEALGDGDAPDAECIGCGNEFFSGDGHPNFPICPRCNHV